MPMTLILGRVGCAKTSYIADRIAERLDAHPDQTVTLIVPDQYTVASENYFLDRLGEKRFRFLNVTSLKSLARTQFAAHGIPGDVIGEGGKTVLLKKAFDAVSPSLRYYPPEYRNPRFLPLLLGAIRELKNADVSADELLALALREKNDKLHDLAVIRQVYEGLLSEGFFDPDDAPARLCKLLAETGDFEDEAVYVTNFHTFYNSERNILLQMLKNGADLTVALPTDTLSEEEDGPIGAATREARTLAARGRAMGEDVRIDLRQAYARFSNPEFAAIEREFSRPQGEVFAEEPKHVRLFCGADRFDEAEEVASVIARKVREEGYRYSDFTVLVRSLQEYSEILDPVFDQYGIPLFYHRRTPLSQRSPMPFIASLFSMALEGMSRDAVLGFVKSGFFTSPEYAAQFERYVKTWNVSYNLFFTPFTRPITGLGEERASDVPLREHAEEVRLRLTETVERLKTGTKNATVRTICTVLFELLEELKIADRLEEHAREYRKYGEFELAARQKKVFEQLILALDEMVLTAGDDRLTLGEFRDLFFAVIDTHDVAILPTSLDEVLAGSPETVPLTTPRCTFVLGLNEGVFPRNIEDSGLLTDRDRAQLSPFGIGETTDDKVNRETFYLYRALTAPRDELYLSYAAIANGELAPSPAVETLRALFPRLKTEHLRTSDPASLAERIQREKAAFALHTKTPVGELEEYFRTSREYADILEKREQTSALSPEAALRLYPKDLSLTASKSDTFHRCRYAYFVRYGLNITPRRDVTIDPLLRGTLVHEMLERFLAQGLDDSDEELHRRIVAFGEETVAKLFADAPVPESWRYHFNALLGKVERLIKIFRKELAVSKFVPIAFEKRIDPIRPDAVAPITVPLDNGTLSLTGAVDRVDLYEKDGKKYLRIVDYKTGTKEFSRKYVELGIDVQMLLYLHTLQQNLFPGELCVPAGIQYVGATPAFSDALRNAADEDGWEAKITRDGLFLNDPEILNALDPTPERKYLGIKIQKQATSKKLVTEEEFGRIFDSIRDSFRRMGNALHEGRLEKNPIRIASSYCSCEKCDLRHYCRHPEPQRVEKTLTEGGENHAEVD